MKKNEVNKELRDNNVDDNFNETLDEDDDKMTKRDALKAVGEIFADYHEAYKQASKKDKRIILAIFIPLAVTFILGVIGVFIANMGQYFALHNIEIIGFIFMGIGLRGFFLIIVGLIIWSQIRENKK